MTVADPYLIDGIMESADEQTYVLLMTEERPFHDSNEQVDQLIEKINTYVTYIESGQLHNDHPRAKGKQLEVLMVCWEVPAGDQYRELLDWAAVLFGKQGAEFRVEVLSSDLVRN